MVSKTPFFAVLLLAFLGLTGCDTTDDPVAPIPEAGPTFQGRVTDNPGYGKRQADVEGAVVTAATVESNGTLRAVAGEATTNADGAYTLAVEEEAAADFFVLTATKADFESRVLVAADGQTLGTLRAMPMTTESKAEADVYVDVRARGNQDSGRGTATVADVAAYVDQRLALALDAGTTTAADVAATIHAAARAEAEYLNDEDEVSDDERERIEQNERAAFVRLQADLHVSSNTQAQAAALDVFVDALIDAYTSAGLTLETQARTRQAGRAALIKFNTTGTAETRLALRRQAEVLTALATAQAIEATFAAEGAAQGRLDALATARTTLLADLRAAAATSDVLDAYSRYETSVEAELATELGINAALLLTAETALTPIKAALDASVDAAASAAAIADAYAVFYTTAQATVETALATSAKASLGARVLALLSVQ